MLTFVLGRKVPNRLSYSEKMLTNAAIFKYIPGMRRLYDLVRI